MKTIKYMIISSIIVCSIAFSAMAQDYSALYSKYYRMGMAEGMEKGKSDRREYGRCMPERHAEYYRIIGKEYMESQIGIIGYRDFDILNGLIDGYYQGYSIGCK